MRRYYPPLWWAILFGGNWFQGWHPGLRQCLKNGWTFREIFATRRLHHWGRMPMRLKLRLLFGELRNMGS